MEKNIIGWAYVKNLNEVNDAILRDTGRTDANWEGLTDAKQITNITYDSNHGCYVVFWKYEYQEVVNE